MPRIETNEIEGATSQSLYSAKVTLTAAQVRALNTTPQVVVPAPGAGLFLVFETAVVRKLAATVFGSVGAGDDLQFRYTNATGTLVGTVETTGFLTGGVGRRVISNGTGTLNPAVNAALIIRNVGAVTGGTSVEVEVFYRVVEG